MRYPPRLAHLATRAIIVAKLLPSYAQAHQVDDDEARERLERALAGSLLEELLASTWSALAGKTRRLDEAGLLEKVAKALQDRPMRPGRIAPASAALSAFWIQVDLAAETASDAARKVMATEQGRQMAAAGMVEGGKFLASELTRT